MALEEETDWRNQGHVRTQKQPKKETLEEASHANLLIMHSKLKLLWESKCWTSEAQADKYRWGQTH